MSILHTHLLRSGNVNDINGPPRDEICGDEGKFTNCKKATVWTSVQKEKKQPARQSKAEDGKAKERVILLVMRNVGGYQQVLVSSNWCS